MDPGIPDSRCWTTGDLGIASYLSAHGFSPIVEVPSHHGALSRFSFDNADGQLDALILGWGRGGEIEAAAFWAAINNLKTQIREARRQANQP